MSSKWYILIAALVLFVATGIAVSWHNAWLEGLDAAALRTAVAARTPALTTIMKSASTLGTALVYVAVLGAGLAVHKQTGWRVVVIALVSLALAQLVRLLVNLLTHRPRPPQAFWLVHPSFYSFPSGHTALAAVGFGLAAWLIWMSNQHAGIVAVVIAILLALLVATSRVYLGVHWASDVVGSFEFAVAWLMLTLIVAARITGAS